MKLTPEPLPTPPYQPTRDKPSVTQAQGRISKNHPMQGEPIRAVNEKETNPMKLTPEPLPTPPYQPTRDKPSVTQAQGRISENHDNSVRLEVQRSELPPCMEQS